MKTIYTFFLMFVCSAILVSCSKDDNTDDSNNPSSVFPFVKENNTWTYDVMMEGATASTTVIYKIKTIDSENFCHIDFVNPLGVLSNDFQWYAGDDFFAEESGTFADNWFPLIYKNNTVGKKWTAPWTDEVLGDISREIVSTTESVTVPAGTFAGCIKIKQTYSADAKIIDYYWVSLQSGIVKRFATGWGDTDEQPRFYFDINYQLKSKSF
ncbi:MAG TPA: hypothetical protein VHO72_17870 [Bacteroidales bacterium]|nr:hypothetical protein [Bacteroidales bacterium]